MADPDHVDFNGFMEGIHESCRTYGNCGGGYIDYVRGANIAEFKKVADAMLVFGVV